MSSRRLRSRNSDPASSMALNRYWPTERSPWTRYERTPSNVVPGDLTDDPGDRAPKDRSVRRGPARQVDSAEFLEDAIRVGPRQPDKEPAMGDVKDARQLPLVARTMPGAYGVELFDDARSGARWCDEQPLVRPRMENKCSVAVVARPPQGAGEKPREGRARGGSDEHLGEGGEVDEVEDSGSPGARDFPTSMAAHRLVGADRQTGDRVGRRHVTHEDGSPRGRGGRGAPSPWLARAGRREA